MASRHDIINITFQANAGKANVALQALQTEAKKSSDRVKDLKKQLEEGLKANLPADQIQKIKDDIKATEREVKQWNKAYQELTKGVRTLDEAVKQFNAGTMGKMSAAFNKAAVNAAKLAQTKMTPGTQEWKEMDALIVEAQSNVLKANTAINDLTANIKKGGTASKSTLTQAKSDLEQLLTLEVRGSKEWENYNKQLKIVNGELNRLADAEKKAAQADQVSAMTKRMKGLKTMSSDMLAETKRYWEAMVAGAEKGSAELTKYESKLKQVVNEEKRRKKGSVEKVLAAPENYGTEQIRQAVQQATQLRDALKAGTPMWQHYNNLVLQGKDALKKYDEMEKIVRGDAISLANALKLSSAAGTGAFKGTAADLQKAQQALEQSLATTDKGTAKYQRLQQAIVRIKAEMAGAGMSSQQMQKILADPKAEKSVETLRNAVGRARGELDVMGQRIERMQRLLAQAEKNGNKRWADRLRESIKQTTKAYDDLAASTKKADQAQKTLANTSKGTASAFDKAWSRLKTYIGLYMGAAVAIRKLTGTMSDLAELSDKMGEVRKTTGFTAEEVGRLSANLKKMDVRTTLVELMEVSAAAGQLGLKTLDDVQGFTEASNKLMIALPEMGKEAATEMMRVAIATGEVEKIRKQLQEGTIEGSSATAVAMEKIASTIDRLRATSASTAPEITDFVKRVGAVGAQSGITIDQVSALGSTISSLGMRVEMSATALSRMIPAIKNNAFDIARAIGVTPDTIRELFDTGRGMEAILMILQHMKDTNMDEESIEAMMGMGSMRDIMKDLNQQGARAGIVFAGLSQNVGELRRQLGVASEAYEENIAVQQEFEKMNETTAAKWERLKNAVEEMFIGDESQRWLGSIIDGLRWIVDTLTGPLAAAFKSGLVFASFYFLGIGGLIYKGVINPIRQAVTGIHSFKTQTMAMAATWRRAWRSMDAATKATWIGAIASAVFMLGKAIFDWATKVNELDQALAKLDNDEAEAERSLNSLMNTFTAADKKTVEAKKKQEALEEETKNLREEVDKLRHSNDNNTDATDRLSKKEEELKQKEKDLKEATDDSNKANGERSKLISEINSKYSSYLGYMLDEKTAAEQVALAHWQIVDALKEELEQKRLGKKLEAIDEELNEGIDKAGTKSRSAISTLPADMQRRIINQWNTVRGRIQYGVDEEGNAVYRLPQIEGVNTNEVAKGSYEELRPYLQSAFASIVKNEVKEAQKTKDRNGNAIQIDFGTHMTYSTSTQYGQAMYIPVKNTLDDFIKNAFSQFDKWTEKTIQREERITEAREDSRAVVEGIQANSAADAEKTNEDAYSRITDTLDKLSGTQKLSTENINMLAQQANIITANLSKFKGELKDADRFVGKDNEVSLENAVDTMFDKLTEAQRKQILAAAQKLQGTVSTTGLGDGNNPWGNRQPAESTNYADMNAEALVNRRKQMNNFVNAIQTDSDVKAVLAEDKALKKAIEAGMSSDMRTVIEWYNTERLKIQDELHARHLTNTGDWMDPKKKKAAHKQFQDEVRTYLEELDAYYTERKAKIEEARNSEEITEGEAWRRNLKNENEWHQRRAELQKLYAEKSAEVTEAEQQAIFSIIAERTGDDEDFIEKMIGKTVKFAREIEKSGEKGEAMVHEWRAGLGLGWERDFLKAQQAITQQVKFIEDTLAKERPYDSITKNLKDNLDKMGVLAAHFRRINDELTARGEEPRYSDEDITAQTYREMAFYLSQAENAYSVDIDELLRRMAREGMAVTAEEIGKSDMLKQAVMGQLRKTYQEVQDAIKKEASQIKKNVDILWNDETLGPDGKSIKATFDKAIARLGMRQDSVGRANSLIGAGAASDNVASRIAMKQIEVQMHMQEMQFNMYRTQARQRIAMLKAEAEEHQRIAEQMKMEGNEAEEQREILAATTALRDADNVRRSLGLTLAEETKKMEELNAELLKQQEEIQARLYRSLKEWGEIISSSLQGVMEASNTGLKEYYNERAKLDLTGKGGPGAGTYVVIDNAGTKGARAHYEYLGEREALDRQREIERQNAMSEAWKKMADDLNQKMSDMITDQVNAMLQNQSLDANTDATLQNTEAIAGLTNAVAGQSGAGLGSSLAEAVTHGTGGLSSGMQEGLTPEQAQEFIAGIGDNPMLFWEEQSKIATQSMLADMKTLKDSQQKTGSDMAASAQAAFAKMTAAANLYGIAYQAMSNDNLSAAQKFEMIAVQAAGQAAIAMLTTDLAAGQAKQTVQLPGILGKLLGEMPYPAAMATFAVVTALMGGLMGLAVSKIAKSKSEISQATGASSANAGKLATGMLAYAEGNVNELTDPATLTPGRHYNVDAADGRTYRAKYTGRGARTHITTGPEFHLVGEKGREAIIDARTTRNIQMNDPEIWRTIQTLYNGGSMSAVKRRRGRGVHAFADGNLDGFTEYEDVTEGAGMGFDPAALQSSLDRNSAVQEALLERLKEPIVARNIWTGAEGIPNMYNKYQKEAQRHGEKYL